MGSACIFDQPISRLAENFNFRADADGVWHLPERLYERFTDAFELLVVFHGKACSVVHDKEHASLIEMGRRRFRLPPRNFLRKELEGLNAGLRSFDPFTIRQTVKGDVDLSLKQLEGFYRCFSAGRQVIDEIGKAYQKTQYLEYFKYLKDIAEAPYQGPTCISEANNLYLKLRNLQKRQMEFLASPH